MMDTTERPRLACVLCPPPLKRAWPLAMSGHRTCGHCSDKLAELLVEIAERFERLDPKPGGQGDLGTRGSPGFGSRAPGSDHIIVMRDPRSSRIAHVWVGSDGRVHYESTHPPLSVYSTLEVEVYDVAEQRQIQLPDPCHAVRHLAVYLHRHLDWLTRQDHIVELFANLRDLAAQMRGPTGDPAPKRIGPCPNVIDRGATTVECGAPLYAPAYGDTIRCWACHREWERHEWLRLGDLLESA